MHHLNLIRNLTFLVMVCLGGSVWAAAAQGMDQSNNAVKIPLADSMRGTSTALECIDAATSKVGNYALKRHNVGAVNLAYWEGPDNGPPLVIIPGMAVPWQSYKASAQILCKSFHLFIVTQRGHVPTGWAKDRAYNVSDYGGDTVKLIREVIKEPVIISGHSLGGLVALWVASTHPDDVIGFVAEDGAFLVNEPKRWKGEWVREMFIGLEKRLRAYHEHGATVEQVSQMFAEEKVVFPSVEMSYERRIMALGKLLSLNQAAGMLPIDANGKKKIYTAYNQYLAGKAPKNGDFWPASVIKLAATAALDLDPEVVAASVSATLSDGFDNRKAFSKVKAPTLYWESDRELTGVLTKADHEELIAIVKENDVRTKYIYAINSGHRIHRDIPEKFAHEIKAFFLNNE